MTGKKASLVADMEKGEIKPKLEFPNLLKKFVKTVTDSTQISMQASEKLGHVVWIEHQSLQRMLSCVLYESSVFMAIIGNTILVS